MILTTSALITEEETLLFIQQSPTSMMPRFRLGSIGVTELAHAALRDAGQLAIPLLAKHVSGNWGDLPQQECEENEANIGKPLVPLTSAFRLVTGVVVWITTLTANQPEKHYTEIFLRSDLLGEEPVVLVDVGRMP